MNHNTSQWQIQDFPGVHQPFILQTFCQKLHENEKKFGPRGRARVPGAPLDLQLQTPVN